MDAVSAWKGLEALIEERGLGWALHRVPETLRVARQRHLPLGSELSHLLPASYRRFVDECGYPILGFSYYCRVGLSFLPPEHMETLSPMLFSPEGDELETSVDAPARCDYAMFAGYELSDIEGYAFGAGEDGELGVWNVEGGMARDYLGSFDEWMAEETARLRAYVEGLSAEEIEALEKECDGETDPHRVIDYALYQDQEHTGFSDEDLRLHWVENQSSDPYEYGLIDDDGTWLIPMGQPYSYVAPFRSGRAIVRRGEERFYVDTRGERVGDASFGPLVYGKNELDSEGAFMALVGRLDKISVGQFQEEVKRIGAKLEREPSPLVRYIVVGDCSYFPDALAKAEELAAAHSKIRLLSEREFLAASGFVWPRY